MTFLEAAIDVLAATDRPLTTAEITTEAVRRGLVRTRGKTPVATFAARLYMELQRNPQPRVSKVAEPGRSRARRGSVRWRLPSLELE